LIALIWITCKISPYTEKSGLGISLQPIVQLDEALRLQYLEALNVTQWVLREEPDLVVNVPQQSESQAQFPQPAHSQQTAESRHTLEFNQAISAKNDDLDKVDSTEMEVSNNASSPQLQTNTKDAAQETSDLSDVTNVSHAKLTAENSTDFTMAQHFLKLVNCSLNQQAENKILIICRHQKDQPAHSFAKASAPSQFMQDYLGALVGLAKAKNIELNTQLAHLSEAGLGADCQKIETVFTDLKPRMVLMLGDEAVKNTLGPEHSVATTRSQVLSLFGEVPIVVSYHPYTLIKNPQLKKSAFEDLIFVSQMLAQSSAQ
jgi:hypothetical protein